MAWSIGRLAPDELRAYERLAVFVQGFDRASAHAIAAPGWTELELGDFLARLARRSLVRIDRTTDGVRFVVPPALRELARARLLDHDDSDEVCDSHAAWFATLAHRSDAELRGPDLDRWIRILGREHPNLRAALERSDEANDLAVLHRLVAGLCRYWDWTGRLSEAMFWLDRALESTPDHHTADSTWIVIWAAYFSTEAADFDVALEHADDAIARAQSAGDLDQQTAACGNRSIALRCAGDLDGALAAGRRAVAAADSAETPWLRAWAASALAAAYQEAGRHDDAVLLARQSLEGFRRLGDRAAEAWSLDLLARGLVAQGDASAAERHARHALLNAHLVGARRSLASALRTLALVARERGNLTRAVSLVSAAHTVTDHGRASGRHPMNSITSAAAHALTPGAYAAAWDAGTTLDLDTILDAL